MPTEPMFSYSAAPQPVKPRNKYRNVGEEAGLTLMSDPRVRRGITLGSAKGAGPGHSTSGLAAPPSKPKKTSARAPTGASSHPAPGQPMYSFEVAGFAGSEFNLDQYLVANEEVKQSNQNESSQTDEFVPLPPPAEYVPRKTGVDICTQVENQQELFSFDAEVRPMVDVIVKKTLEQALFELSSEDELKTLQSEIDKFNVEKEAESRWIYLKERETIEDNKLKEKERADRLKLLQVEEGVRRTVGASAAMRQLLPALFSAVADDLFQSGIWKDEAEEEAAVTVLPSLAAAAGSRTERYAAAVDMVEGEFHRSPPLSPPTTSGVYFFVFAELLLRAQDIHAELGEVEHIKRKNVHVHVTLSAKETGGDEDTFLGCFRLNPRSTLASLEQDVQVSALLAYTQLPSSYRGIVIVRCKLLRKILRYFRPSRSRWHQLSASLVQLQPLIWNY